MKATNSDIKALRKALATMRKVLNSDPFDVESAMKAAEEFHLAFCAAAHNKLLENIAWPIINHSMMTTWKSLDDVRDLLEKAIKGHQEMLEGLEKRDSKRVINATEQHLKEAFERISAVGLGRPAVLRKVRGRRDG